MSFLETRKLTTGYGRRVILDDVEITLLKGQVISVLGPNGSGKTTLLRTIAGILAPLAGTVYLSGRDMSSLKEAELARELAFLPTGQINPSLLTVFELVALGRYPYTNLFGKLTKADRDKVTEILELVGAGALVERYFHELSDGEKQKVSLARALVQEPELLVLDEPTSYLDIKHCVEIITILNRLSKDRKLTVLMSMHDIELALKCSDQVLLMKNGKVAAFGPPEEVISTTAVTNLYDLKSGKYSELLGAIELPLTRSEAAPRLFITGGDGTGLKAYRFLSHHGRTFAAGILHANDIDYHIATIIGAKVIGEAAFEPVGDSAFTAALKILEGVTVFIDTGYPIGYLNQRNNELILKALQSKKTVISFRKPETAAALFPGDYKSFKFCANLSNLNEFIELL